LLVDDMLDEDPRGVYHMLGQAATANLAFASQAAAFRVIEQAPVDAGRRAAAYASLARMALTTAFGQNLDAQNLREEEGYWRVVETKTAPCFSVAAEVGGLLGGATNEVAGNLRRFGLLYGEAMQIYDDLADAFSSPAGPDWILGRNNLAILYARTADHADRARFEALLPCAASDPQALADAHEILLRSGAVSFGAYHVIRRRQAAREILDATPLADPAPLLGWLELQGEPLVKLLERVGAEVPPQLGEI
jgi:geranylgeranyl pyrophosphate synthase